MDSFHLKQFRVFMLLSVIITPIKQPQLHKHRLIVYIYKSGHVN